MRLRFVTAVMCGLVFISTLFATEKPLVVEEDYIQFADNSYANKDMAITERKKVADTMIIAADKFPGNYDVLWRAAQALYAYSDTLYYQYQLDNYLSAQAKNKVNNVNDLMNESLNLSKSQSQELLRLGIIERKYAGEAVKIKPEGIEGQYYSAMGIATYAFGKSIVSALMEGLGPKYEEHLNNALKINKEYQKGQLYTAFGRYWYKLPWPKRNLKRSQKDLLESEAIHQDNILTLDYLGDTYFAQGKKDEAVSYWKKAIISEYKTYHTEIVKKLVNAKLQLSEK